MTPDRNDPTHDDTGEHAVLSDAASVETSGIGILGGHTAQVDVVLPPHEDDDLVDDDVVDDVRAFTEDGPLVIEIHESEVEAAPEVHPEIVAEAVIEDDTVVPESVHAPATGDVEDAVVVDDIPLARLHPSSTPPPPPSRTPDRCRPRDGRRTTPARPSARSPRCSRAPRSR